MSNSSKTVHHSQLTYWTRDNGGAWLQLQKTPGDSKFSKDVAGFCTILDPDGAQKYLNLETQSIRAAFEQVPLNTPVWVEAGGERAEAWAVIKDQKGNVLQDSRVLMAAGAGGPPNGGPPAGPPSGPPAGPPQTGAAGPGMPPQHSAPPAPPQGMANPHPHTNGTAPSMAATMYRALEAAAEVMDKFGAERNELTADMTADGYMERVGAIATTFFIEYQRSGGTKPFTNPSTN